MLQLIASVLIDAIDASPIDELSVVGIPAVAIAEGLIIYWTTKSKALAVTGMLESVIPVVDIIPFATISWIIKHGKLIGIILLAVLIVVMYLLGWLALPI
ncbi:MAG: hypothetical protein ABIF85_07100 [Nanoarchaeota archaeon]|nr:hypothetical protein [Nanoarchaeota archaeon]MBU4300544.1 hypothetical protein [Nanoarchaeota archaeon]MBU4452082.1 hypothetical protein [Nanoarchaeota archaeon]MCG2724185.1 hypothetical protein [archaeon]